MLSVAISQRRGFTMVELTIAVAIIALLSSVVLVSMSSTRARGRDSRREADIREISSAMNIYYQANGQYPQNLSSTTPRVMQFPIRVRNILTGALPNTVKYLDRVPNDPQTNMGYMWVNNGNPDAPQEFCIYARYENQYGRTYIVASKAGMGRRNTAPVVNPTIQWNTCAPTR